MDDLLLPDRFFYQALVGPGNPKIRIFHKVLKISFFFNPQLKKGCYKIAALVFVCGLVAPILRTHDTPGAISSCLIGMTFNWN